MKMRTLCRGSPGAHSHEIHIDTESTSTHDTHALCSLRWQSWNVRNINCAVRQMAIATRRRKWKENGNGCVCEMCEWWTTNEKHKRPEHSNPRHTLIVDRPVLDDTWRWHRALNARATYSNSFRREIRLVASSFGRSVSDTKEDFISGRAKCIWLAILWENAISLTRNMLTKHHRSGEMNLDNDNVDDGDDRCVL